MDTGIYAIRNITNGKCYIGSAQSFNSRFRVHKSYLNNNRHHNAKLQRAWNKYGAKNFVFEKLIICSKEDLLMYEQRAIDAHDSAKNGYNIRLIATSNLGIKYSEETKQKMSKDRRMVGIKKRMKSIILDKCTLKYWFFNLGGNDKLCSWC